MDKYLDKIDKIIMSDVRKLINETLALVAVMLTVPLHIFWLLLRIMFPWLIPLLTKEDA